MTEADPTAIEPEQGSDAQFTHEQAAELARRTDLQEAETIEEERKTAAQPVEDDPAAA